MGARSTIAKVLWHVAVVQKSVFCVNQIQNMPLNGRDFGNLAYLAPGARPVNSYDPTKNRVAVIAINGSNGRNINVTVNGIDDKDNTVGGPVMQLGLSAIEEADISTQRFSAANGRSEGAAINVITKAGSNKFHGGGYFYDTQTALNYVLSRAVGWDVSAASFGNRPVDPFNPFNPKLDFGPVPNDERHHVAVSGVVSLPWGFEVAPILQFGSARPYTSTAGLDILGVGSSNGAAHAVVPVSDPKNYTYYTVLQNQANQANPGSLPNSKLIQMQQSCLAAGECLMVPFDNLRGQDYFQLDTRLTKSFNFAEKGTLRLIFQAFDITNRANFGNTFGGSIRSLGTFEQPTGYIAPSGTVIPKSFRGEFGVEYTF